MTTQNHHHSWQRAWIGIGASGDGTAVHSALLEKYAEPHRAYHSLQHLDEVLSAFELVRDLAKKPAEVELALWFHDAIYDVHSHDNEARSADWAGSVLSDGGASAASVERVRQLILATQHTAAPTTPDECLLVDIDLGILGAEPDRFAEYDRQIRQEYGFVPEPLFTQKRRAILLGFLARERIYGTAHFHAALESRARENLQGAIAALVPL
jgi:predicted metal-dependent HD superfamily phosphohydrolase